MSEKEKKTIIDSLLTRGIENIYPTREFVESLLNTGERLTIYHGIDPTGPTLHLGHAIELRKLALFQKLGHRVILLIGDFTAMIGDPTDKSAVRKQLTREEVLSNCGLYKEQASRFLKFGGENKAEVVYNSEWLDPLRFPDILRLASTVTVSQMLERDMFTNRMKEGKPIFLHEFMYPLMQGYDSVILQADGEMGGNDQTFNMLMGRTMAKHFLNKEKFVLTLKLLADPTGKKMGKTENNMISLLDSPEDMFGKVMSWSDAMMLPAFEICTDVPVGEIDELRKQMSSGGNPRDLKMRLAEEMIAACFDKEKANAARESFVRVFQKKEIPDDMASVESEMKTLLKDVLVKEGLVKSNSDFVRLVKEGAVSVGGEVIDDIKYCITQDLVVKVGKHRFLKVMIKR